MPFTLDIEALPVTITPTNDDGHEALCIGIGEGDEAYYGGCERDDARRLAVAIHTRSSVTLEDSGSGPAKAGVSWDAERDTLTVRAYGDSCSVALFEEEQDRLVAYLLSLSVRGHQANSNLSRA